MFTSLNEFILVCFVDRAFDDVKIAWRVTFNETSVILQKDGVNLANELVAVLGVTVCNAGQIKCTISIEIKPDNVSIDYNELITQMASQNPQNVYSWFHTR